MLAARGIACATRAALRRRAGPRRSRRRRDPDRHGWTDGRGGRGRSTLAVPGAGDRASPQAGRARRAGARHLPRLAAAGRAAPAPASIRTRAPDRTARPSRRARSAGARSICIGADREPVLAGLGSPLLVLHWHGDTYDLPPGAAHLASTPVCRHQAFRLGRRQFGFQFHCELEADTDRASGSARTPTTSAAPTATMAARRSWPTPCASTRRAQPVWDRLLGNAIDLLVA